MYSNLEPVFGRKREALNLLLPLRHAPTDSMMRRRRRQQQQQRRRQQQQRRRRRQQQQQQQQARRHVRSLANTLCRPLARLAVRKERESSLPAVVGAVCNCAPSVLATCPYRPLPQTHAPTSACRSAPPLPLLPLSLPHANCLPSPRAASVLIPRRPRRRVAGRA